MFLCCSEDRRNERTLCVPWHLAGKIARKAVLCITTLVLAAHTSCGRKPAPRPAERTVVKTWPSGRPRYVIEGKRGQRPFVAEEYYESGRLKGLWKFGAERQLTGTAYDSKGGKIREIIADEETGLGSVTLFGKRGKIEFFARYADGLTSNEYTEYDDRGRKTDHRLVAISKDGKLGNFPVVLDKSQERNLATRWLRGDWYAWEWLIRSNIPVERRAWYMVDGMRKRAEDKGKEEGPELLNPWKVFQLFNKNCGKEMVPGVVALLSDTNPEVRVSATVLLGVLRGIRGVREDTACAAPVLGNLLYDDSGRVREFAGSMLGSIAGTRFGHDVKAARRWWEDEGSKTDWPQPPPAMKREEILAQLGIGFSPRKE